MRPRLFHETYQKDQFCCCRYRQGVRAGPNQSCSTWAACCAAWHFRRTTPSKLVRVTKGEVYDVAGLPPPQRHLWASGWATLSEENKKMFYIPGGLRPRLPWCWSDGPSSAKVSAPMSMTSTSEGGIPTMTPP